MTSTAPGTNFSRNYYEWYIPWELMIDIKCVGKTSTDDKICSYLVSPVQCYYNNKCNMVDSDNKAYVPLSTPSLEISYNFFNTDSYKVVQYPESANLYP